MQCQPGCLCLLLMSSERWEVAQDEARAPTNPVPSNPEPGSLHGRVWKGTSAVGSQQYRQEGAQQGPNPHLGSPAPPKGGVLVFIYSAAHCIHSTLSISIT